MNLRPFLVIIMLSNILGNFDRRCFFSFIGRNTYDKTKRAIIFLSAGKSGDMNDINHEHNIVN